MVRLLQKLPLLEKVESKFTQPSEAFKAAFARALERADQEDPGFEERVRKAVPSKDNTQQGTLQTRSVTAALFVALGLSTLG